MSKAILRNKEQKLIKKANNLVKAYNKAKEIYSNFENFIHAFLYNTNLSPFEKDFGRDISNTFKWDEVNDLIMRLEDKYNDVISELGSVRFELYGFSVVK